MAAEVTFSAYLSRMAVLGILAVPTSAVLSASLSSLPRSPGRLLPAAARSSGYGYMMYPSFGMLLTALSYLAFGTFLFLLVQQAISGTGGTGTGTGTGGGGRTAEDPASWSELTFLLNSVDEVPELMAEAVLKTTRVLTLGRSACRARRLCRLNSRAQRDEVYKGLVYNVISAGVSLIPTEDTSLWEKLAAIIEARTGGNCEATFPCVSKPG